MLSRVRSSTPERGARSWTPLVQFRTRAGSPLCRVSHNETDIAVIGAGVTGLCVAHSLLQYPRPLSLVAVERRQPCAGATGAGQGYLWLAHRDPSSPSWPLAYHSRRMWDDLLNANSRLAEEAEWQVNGSLLVGVSEEDEEALKNRHHRLADEGINSCMLTYKELVKEEPALKLTPGSSALLVPGDSQLNGRQTTWALLRQCQELGQQPGKQFQALMDEAALQLLGPPPGRTSGWTLVTTSGRRLVVKEAVVVAAGVWSGELLGAFTGDQRWLGVLRPRRGHLLEVEAPVGMAPLRHGVMEVSYTKHYAGAASMAQPATGTHAVQPLDITFTATTSAQGTLLLGSSREPEDWNTTPVPEVIQAILSRACTFLPDLGSISAQATGVRVGLRPYALGTHPIVGPVDGPRGLYVAAGHEGSGLCMGPGTGLLMSQYIFEGMEDKKGEVKDLRALCKELLPSHRLAVVGL